MQPMSELLVPLDRSHTHENAENDACCIQGDEKRKDEEAREQDRERPAHVDTYRDALREKEIRRLGGRGSTVRKREYLEGQFLSRHKIERFSLGNMFAVFGLYTSWPAT